MGDSAYGWLQVFHVASALEVGTICEAIDETFGEATASGPTEALILNEEYDGTVSVGKVEDMAYALALSAPGSCWAAYQAGCGFNGDDVGHCYYHFPGLGVFECREGPLWTSVEVHKFLRMNVPDRQRAMGEPWIQAADGFRGFMDHVPQGQRTFKRPTPDELEALTEKDEREKATQ